jgi:cytochrome c biogenesis protein CcmG, thiol:disulfide interchange protein DsbE
VSDVSRPPGGAAAFVTLLVAVGLATPAWSAEAQALPSAPTVRDATANTGLNPELAPDFTRIDVAGKAIRLSSYRGKVVLLNFWATWCAPCLAEIPAFSGWQQKYGPEGLQILGVSMDDDSGPVKLAVHKYHVVYPVVMGDENLGELYGGVLGLPLSFIIDPSGRIVARYQGKSDLAQLEFRLKALLPRPRR